MNKKISELTEYITPVEGDFLAVVDTTNGETKKIDFINFKGDKGDDGTNGVDGAKVESVAFVGNDMVFTQTDSSTATLTNAKLDLKGDTGTNGVGVIITGTSATAAATAAKTVTISGYTLTAGDLIALTLTSGNTAASMTLNINGGGAIEIHVGGLAPTALTGAVTAGGTILLYYNGTVFVMTGATRDTNTTYTLPVKATGAELDTGTDDAKFATAKAIKDSLNVPSVIPSTSGNVLTSNGTNWTSAAIPTLNQNTTGSAASLKSPSTTGLGRLTGMGTGQTRDYTVPDSNATLLYSGGALGTPSGGTLTNCTGYPAASTTAAGISELAIASEVNTGTSDVLAVTPDALAGSVMGTKGFCIVAVAPTTNVSAADGKAYIMIPECMNGMNLIRANASVITAGTTNATTIDIYNVTDSHDMLSTAISIASAGTVGTAGTVNASYDDVATNDILRIDVTSASTTNAKGLQVILEFQLP